MQANNMSQVTTKDQSHISTNTWKSEQDKRRAIHIDIAQNISFLEQSIDYRDIQKYIIRQQYAS